MQQTQTVWIETLQDTGAAVCKRTLAGTYKIVVSGYVEKREGVIILTPEELESIKESERNAAYSEGHSDGYNNGYEDAKEGGS
jgi:hypothetical protein